MAEMEPVTGTRGWDILGTLDVPNGQDKASVAMIAFDSSGTTILQQTVEHK